MRKKRGRPKKKETLTKFMTSVTVEQMDYLRKKSQKEGDSIAGLIRKAIESQRNKGK